MTRGSLPRRRTDEGGADNEPADLTVFPAHHWQVDRHALRLLRRPHGFEGLDLFLVNDESHSLVISKGPYPGDVVVDDCVPR